MGVELTYLPELSIFDDSADNEGDVVYLWHRLA
jgi:hypothetical protein